MDYDDNLSPKFQLSAYSKRWIAASVAQSNEDTSMYLFIA
ncbi:hypothetical protein HMPREF1584_01040 [Gardnerella vaginalis JCP8481A]|uniref:Uncharacterized protein n=1 Tax=Gardnerella vaginalis TaxID=2702 RepID=A0A133NV57_GARVA|nr:hypothetical protein HMPREF1584_01040 [Gardnerella vaginalis JCP8481A]EPI42658.1 hypothetical protein HMPREF1585_00755 [Gardnerella vaginalis JCP8481B]KXA20156.1 hypothetical protein HMPREF3208_00850 [Gardnerella vaginalis]